MASGAVSVRYQAVLSGVGATSPAEATRGRLCMAVGCGNLASPGFQDGGCEAFGDFLSLNMECHTAGDQPLLPGISGVHRITVFLSKLGTFFEIH